jgi:hypothetical protein
LVRGDGPAVAAATGGLKGRLGNPPIVYVGDIWDHYRQPPEAINWAIRELPKGYAIPGQHDLRHHNYEDIKKTAYWTLMEAGVILDMRPWHILRESGMGCGCTRSRGATRLRR